MSTTANNLISTAAVDHDASSSVLDDDDPASVANYDVQSATTCSDADRAAADRDTSSSLGNDIPSSATHCDSSFAAQNTTNMASDNAEIATFSDEARIVVQPDEDASGVVPATFETMIPLPKMKPIQSRKKTKGCSCDGHYVIAFQEETGCPA